MVRPRLNAIRADYHEIYKQLDGLAALAVAESTSLTKRKEEADTAFVKRIVAHYLVYEMRAKPPPPPDDN